MREGDKMINILCLFFKLKWEGVMGLWIIFDEIVLNNFWWKKCDGLDIDGRVKMEKGTFLKRFCVLAEEKIEEIDVSPYDKRKK